jgi:hypothetical protein
VIVWRRPDVATRPQLWAEDGAIFFRDALLVGFPRSIFRLYAGYPYVVHRLIAAIGSLFPISAAPRFYTTAAIALEALAVATFSLPRFRHLVQSDALRVGFCVAFVCLPAGVEVFATPTNLGWFLAVWLLFVSVTTAPRRAWPLAAVLGAGILALLSTPLVILLAPLWLLRVLDGAQRRDRREILLGATLLLCLGAVLLLTERMGAQSTELASRHIGSAATTFGWLNLATFSAHTLMRFIAPPEALAQLAVSHAWALYLGSVLVLGIIVGCAAAAGPRRLIATSTFLLLMIAAIGALLIARPIMNALTPYVSGALSSRYGLFPTCCGLLSICVTLDGLAKPRCRRLAIAGTGALLALAWQATFQIPPAPDMRWPSFAARLQEKLDSGSLGSPDIPDSLIPWLRSDLSGWPRRASEDSRAREPAVSTGPRQEE